jgi:hypothetical protein
LISAFTSAETCVDDDDDDVDDEEEEEGPGTHFLSSRGARSIGFASSPCVAAPPHEPSDKVSVLIAALPAVGSSTHIALGGLPTVGGWFSSICTKGVGDLPACCGAVSTV